MSAPASRRGFLRGLTTLPLIGGGITLIGSPTAAAVTVTPGMIGTYIAWLDGELRHVQWAANARGFIPALNPGFAYHGLERDIRSAAREAVNRAPVVLSTVGCRLTCAEAEEQCASYGFSNLREGV